MNRLENVPQSAKAYAEILRMVLGREIRPGQALAVPELAEQLSMSVTPVRDAIRRLESEGLLEVIPRRGTFAKSFDLTDLITGYEAAEALEGMAAYLVAEQIRNGALAPGELDPLDDLLSLMDGFLDERGVNNWADLDVQFHRFILGLCGNKIIQGNWQNLRTQLDCVLWFITPLHVDRHNSMNEHRRIVDAMRRGDAEAARSISQAHKNNVRNTIVRLVKTRPPLQQ